MNRIPEDRPSGDRKPAQQDLLERYGELMPGSAIRTFLHFTSDRSFRRAAAKQALPVAVFRVPGRRGWFARTRDVSAWLEAAAKGGLPHASPMPPREDEP